MRQSNNLESVDDDGQRHLESVGRPTKRQLNSLRHDGVKTVTKRDVPVYDEVNEEQLATRLVPNDTIGNKVDGPGLKRPRGGASLPPPASRLWHHIIISCVAALLSRGGTQHTAGTAKAFRACCNFDLALIFTSPSKTNFEPRAGEKSIISSPIGFDLV